MLISESYRSLNRRLHEEGSYGRKGDKWAARVKELMVEFQPSTILDYGCGQGALARALDFEVQEYDPAILGKNTLPTPADLVVCTDVLEHVEPECVEDVLDHLQSVTRVALFAVISTRPAKKILADGRNAHLLVKDWEWWQYRLSARFELMNPIENHKEFQIVLLPKRQGNN